MKHRKIIIIICSLICLIYILSSICYAIEDTTYVWSNQSSKLETNQVNATLNTSDDTNTSNSLGLESGSACLIDQNTGLVLYDYNMHEQLRPASVTKVMSLLLIMEALDSGRISLTDQVPCTGNPFL